MKTLLALTLLTLQAHALRVPLTWDDPDNLPTEQIAYYVLWQKYGAEWRVATSSNTREVVIDRKNGVYEFCVCAVNVWGESSDYSAPLKIEVKGNKIRTL